MTTTNALTCIRFTDAAGRVIMEAEGDTEPLPGSVVLTHGEWGTAFQRYFKDGLWHRVGGGRGRPWSEMLRQANMVLVYDAPVRPEQEQSNG